MSALGGGVVVGEEAKILFTSEPSDQNKSCSECQQDVSICQYVSMSICQNATFQIRYQNESCSECHQDVRSSFYVSMSIGLYVYRSIGL